MDPQQFDRLMQALGAGLSRRGARRTVLGAGVLGLLGLSQPVDADAAKSGQCKPKCGECEKCDQGKCHKTKSGKKRCTKGKCKAKAPGTPCSGGTCQSGRCVCSFVGLQGVCSSQEQCCTSATGTVCASNFCRPDALPVCCKPVGGSCTVSCDCCGSSFCVGGGCL